MKILSVIIAILFWFMVYTNENPIETRQLTIALTPINVSALSDKNLRILNEYEKSMEITLRGRKTEIDQVSASDFTAYLDFSTVVNEYIDSLEVTGFDYLGERNVIYDISGSGKVGLKVDRIVAGEIPIKVEVIGETAEGFFLVGTPVLQPANFSVTDIKSLVTDIASAVVTVDVSGMKGSTIVRKFCLVYDEFGNEIAELKNKTAVDITINIAKNVPVDVRIEGVPATDHIATEALPEPSHVLVTGSEKELLLINKVSTLPVNVENAKESFTVTSGLQTLPVGIGYVGSGEVEVGVAIEKLQEKTIIFSSGNINIRYGLLNKDYDVISNNIELVVKGRKSVLDLINATSIKAFVDVGNTDDGELSLPLRFENLDNVEQISFPLVDIYIRTIQSITLNTSDIFIINKNGGKYTYELVNAAANISIIGLSGDLEAITYESLKPTIDAAGLTAGTQSVQITVTLPEGVSLSGKFTTQLKITEN